MNISERALTEKRKKNSFDSARSRFRSGGSEKASFCRDCFMKKKKKKKKHAPFCQKFVEKKIKTVFPEFNMKYATFAVWKCELPLVKWKSIAQNVAWSKRMFFKHNPSWEKRTKDYYLLRRIKHFLQLKGLNFDVMFIERVVVVYNTVNEFAASDKKKKI